jgi:THO complex subunit 2
VPLNSYQYALDRIKSQSSEKSTKKKDNSDALIKKLNEEKAQQIKHNEAILALIKRARHAIVPQITDSSKEIKDPVSEKTMWLFLQQCILPRVLFSGTDALYCAKFIELMHLSSVPYFNTLQCYFRAFSSIPAWLMSSTEEEANRIGRFLQVSQQYLLADNDRQH